VKCTSSVVGLSEDEVVDMKKVTDATNGSKTVKIQERKCHLQFAYKATLAAWFCG
jgi:hypothetical protein